MPQPIIILGTGGNAYDILDVIEAINRIQPQWKVCGFLDDSQPIGSDYQNFPILGPLREAPHFRDALFINAIGSDASFRRRPEILAGTGLPRERFATLIHPATSLSSRATIGCDVCIHFGVSVSGNVQIGDHVWIAPGCIVGHDTTIGDYSLLAPGAVLSGFVRVERACYIGAAASIRQRQHLGEGALVGMGAVVVNDVPANTVVVGNPARPLGKAVGSR